MVSDGKITSLSVIGAIDRTTDVLEIVDVSGNASYKVTPNNLIGISGGTALSTVDTQNVQNKTLDNTNTITLKDTLFTLQDDSDSTKQVKFQASGIAASTTRTLTVPDRSSTIATLGGNQVFTGANTFSGSSWSGGTIDNSTVTVDSITGHTTANTGTIYGISVSSGTIGSAALASNAVTTSAIASGAVTASKRSQVIAMGSFTPSATGNKSVTGVGFTPKMVKFFVLSTASTSFCSGGTGAMTATAQYTSTWNTDATSAARYSSTSNCHSLVSASSSTPAQLANFVSMDADGFTVNFSAQNATPVAWEAYA